MGNSLHLLNEQVSSFKTLEENFLIQNTQKSYLLNFQSDNLHLQNLSKSLNWESSTNDKNQKSINGLYLEIKDLENQANSKLNQLFLVGPSIATIPQQMPLKQFKDIKPRQIKKYPNKIQANLKMETKEYTKFSNNPNIEPSKFIIEDQAKDIAMQAKQKALERINIKKQIQDQINVHHIELEKHREQFDDLDGFHLFSEQMEIPTQNDFPNIHHNIEETVIPQSQQFQIKSEDDIQTKTKDPPILEDLLQDQLTEKLIEQQIIEQNLIFDDKEYEDWQKKEAAKEWSIIYSKKPELIIDRDEYDKVLIHLLQSYADFKQSTIDMNKLIQMQKEQIAENKENLDLTKRKPLKIRNFFRNIFEKFFDTSIKIKDVKFRFKQFRDYVKVVSNYEIELIDGGDSSQMKEYIQNLWKILADEHKAIFDEEVINKNQGDVQSESQLLVNQ